MAQQAAEHCTQTQIITGIAEQDRRCFQELSDQQNLLNAMHKRHTLRLDLGEIDRMNIITLGLIAWIQQETRANNCDIEIVNANSITQDTLEMFELDA